MIKTEVAVIGAGPAGISTAIQLKRFGIHFEIFERNEIGGLLINANLVENYPGFPAGIEGVRLVELMRKQLRMLDIRVRCEVVGNIRLNDGVFNLTTDKDTCRSRFAVIATGTTPLKSEIPGIDDSRDRIFYEVYPIRDLSQRNIAIIGAGDAAFDYALNLSKRNRVTVNNRGEQVKCLPLLQQRARAETAITCRTGYELIYVENHPEHLALTWNTPVGELRENSDFLLFAIGRKPETGCMDESLVSNRDRLLKDGRLFLAGDLVNGSCRQAVIACGDGMRAAMQINSKLEQRIK